MGLRPLDQRIDYSSAILGERCARLPEDNPLRRVAEQDVVEPDTAFTYRHTRRRACDHNSRRRARQGGSRERPKRKPHPERARLTGQSARPPADPRRPRAPPRLLAALARRLRRRAHGREVKFERSLRVRLRAPRPGPAAARARACGAADGVLPSRAGRGVGGVGGGRGGREDRKQSDDFHLNRAKLSEQITRSSAAQTENVKKMFVKFETLATGEEFYPARNRTTVPEIEYKARAKAES